MFIVWAVGVGWGKQQTGPDAQIRARMAFRQKDRQITLRNNNFHVDIFKSNKIRVSGQFSAAVKGSARNEIKDRFTSSLPSFCAVDLPSLYFPE